MIEGGNWGPERVYLKGVQGGSYWQDCNIFIHGQLFVLVKISKDSIPNKEGAEQMVHTDGRMDQRTDPWTDRHMDKNELTIGYKLKSQKELNF